jgi:hypothetical protein
MTNSEIHGMVVNQNWDDDPANDQQNSRVDEKVSFN